MSQTARGLFIPSAIAVMSPSEYSNYLLPSYFSRDSLELRKMLKETRLPVYLFSFGSQFRNGHEYELECLYTSAGPDINLQGCYYPFEAYELRQELVKRGHTNILVSGGVTVSTLRHPRFSERTSQRFLELCLGEEFDILSGCAPQAALYLYKALGEKGRIVLDSKSSVGNVSRHKEIFEVVGETNVVKDEIAPPFTFNGHTYPNVDGVVCRRVSRNGIERMLLEDGSPEFLEMVQNIRYALQDLRRSPV